MITAIDTNVLLDVFLPDKKYIDRSAALLRQAYDEGALVICEVVYSELVPQFNDRSLLDSTLARINVTLSSMDSDVAYVAGEKWGLYRKVGGKKERIITDFLIGAHALLKADRFLTRDRGFYKKYFQDLKILGGLRTE
jgi:predicted nucleic acid-binding protein